LDSQSDYGLLFDLIAIVALAAMAILGTSITSLFNDASSKLLG
jgi:Flp pilus assembly pilin Flp